MTESFKFEAEVGQLLDLMVNSLYTEADIFLRELISNSSDALDRLHFEALTNPTLCDKDHKYQIRLIPDTAARTLTVSDTGIGMSRQELISHIGTIARSGTQDLRNRIKESRSKECGLIGQLGVGFYSAFMVASRVVIVTRRVGESTSTCWESAGDGVYTVSGAERSGCGTDVILHLRAVNGENVTEDYTNRWTLANIVTKYSNFIAYPIIYEGSLAEPASTHDEQHKQIKSEPKMLNSMKPIWSSADEEVSESDYVDFYKRLSNDPMDPMKILTLRAEGRSEYGALLFIPSHAPYDLFYSGTGSQVRLYARRVMVMENCEELLPRYLRFIKGVVDSGDLPLNISRQRLQHDQHVRQIRSWLTRKALMAIGDMQIRDPQMFEKLWREFGRALKEGISTDHENRKKLLPLLQFDSSHKREGFTTLKAYVERMKSDQNEIFYLTGQSRDLIENSPHLEAAKQKGYEVLYLSDPVDELVVQQLYDFEGKRFKSVGKGIIELGTEEERKHEREQGRKKHLEYASFLVTCQRVLDKSVKQIRLSTRLVKSPVCLVAEEHEYSPRLERLLQRGKAGAAKQRRIMELNPSHPIILRLYDRYNSDATDRVVGDSVQLLFELALIAEGSEIADPVRLNRITLNILQENL